MQDCLSNRLQLNPFLYLSPERLGCAIASMEEQENKKEDKKKDIQKDTLQPISKVNSKLDKELQEWEVDSTTSGG
jgi:hypothetical protein